MSMSPTGLYLFLCVMSILYDSSQGLIRNETRWGRLESPFQDLAVAVADALSPVLKRMHRESLLSSPCLSSLEQFGAGLKAMKPWAFQMLDATGKIPTGFSEGSFMELGSFDQCVRVKAEGSFVGQHCTVKMNADWELLVDESHDSFRQLAAFSADVPLRMLRDPRPIEVTSLIFGLCLPSKCGKRDVRQILRFVLDGYSWPLEVVRVNCEKKSEGKRLTSWEIAACSFFAILLFLVLTGTVLDLLPTSTNVLKSSKTGEVLRAFSVYTNAKKVAYTNDSGNFSCFNGLRVMSLMWVMLSHTLFLAIPDQITIFKPLSNNLKISQSMVMAVVDNASPSVDTFFVISGFLLSVSVWKTLEANGGRLDWSSIFFRKYWRLIPALVTTMALTLLLPRLGDGPLWKENSEHLARICRQNGWRNLFFLQNLFTAEDTCLVHTWYVACMMQLTVVATPLLWLSYRCFPAGLVLGVLLASVGTVATVALTVQYDLIPAPLYSTYGFRPILSYLSLQLIKPHNHLGAFLIGTAAGYVFLKRGNASIPQLYTAAGWTAAVVAMLGVVFGVQDFRTNKVYGSPYALLYSGFSRNVWALAVAWVSLACVSGRGGFINDVLSWSPFAFLARLSYAAYLLHPLLICYHVSRTRAPRYFDEFSLGQLYISYVVMTFFFSYFFHLLMEMPFANMEKMLPHFKTTKAKKC